MLEHFNSNLKSTIQTDSINGIGCVLLQNGKLIYYASKSLSPVECNYGQIDKEFLTIMFDCNTFYQFVYWQQTTVQTHTICHLFH